MPLARRSGDGRPGSAAAAWRLPLRAHGRHPLRGPRSALQRGLRAALGGAGLAADLAQEMVRLMFTVT